MANDDVDAHMKTSQLRVALAYRALTGMELGEAVGWPRGGRFVHRVLRGEVTISEAKAQKICDYLELHGGLAAFFEEVSPGRMRVEQIPVTWKPPW